jgi:hypothetical protein
MGVLVSCSGGRRGELSKSWPFGRTRPSLEMSLGALGRLEVVGGGDREYAWLSGWFFGALAPALSCSQWLGSAALPGQFEAVAKLARRAQL